MNKLGIVMLAAGLAGIFGLLTAASPQEAIAGAACKRATFETKLVADACKKGGQGEAKKVMKKFLAAAKKQDSSATCQSCHAKLAPAYTLKPDGLEKFKQFGGQ